MQVEVIVYSNLRSNIKSIFILKFWNKSKFNNKSNCGISLGYRFSLSAWAVESVFCSTQKSIISGYCLRNICQEESGAHFASLR